MHDPVSLYNFTSKKLADHLVPQTNAKHRNFFVKSFNDLRHDPDIFRLISSTGPWRKDDMCGFHTFNLADGNLVMKKYFGIAGKLPKILLEDIGKRIVVVDDEDFFHSK